MSFDDEHFVVASVNKPAPPVGNVAEKPKYRSFNDEIVHAIVRVLDKLERGEITLEPIKEGEKEL